MTELTFLLGMNLYKSMTLWSNQQSWAYATDPTKVFLKLLHLSTYQLGPNCKWHINAISFSWRHVQFVKLKSFLNIKAYRTYSITMIYNLCKHWHLCIFLSYSSLKQNLEITECWSFFYSPSTVVLSFLSPLKNTCLQARNSFGFPGHVAMCCKSLCLSFYFCLCFSLFGHLSKTSAVI